jgi:hypothetical protein
MQQARLPAKLPHPAQVRQQHPESQQSNLHHIVQRMLASPKSLSPDEVMSLQRTIGNQALQSMLGQSRLRVGPTHDRYEAEANQMAHQATGQQTMGRERGRRDPGGLVNSATAHSIRQARQGGQRLDHAIQRTLEKQMHTRFGAVKIHKDARADQASRALQARAFTLGNDIFFRRGEYAPHQPEGQAVLAHELTHVQQQRRTTPTLQRLPDDQEFEQMAGAAKADKKLPLVGLTVWHMSTIYKRLLSALAAYGQRTSSNISADANQRNSDAAQLKPRLQAVIDAAAAYYQDKNGQGPRIAEVSKLYTQAQVELASVDKVANMGTFVGASWRAALEPFGKVRQMAEHGELDKAFFHGTHSGFLGKFQGEMMSGAELEKRGIKRDTGEGDFYSAKAGKEGAEVGGGEKNFISVGEGLPGMGTGLAYAKITDMSTDYNTALYSDEELNAEAKQLTQILTHWDESLFKLPSDQQARFQKSKEQFINLSKRLIDEGRIRRQLPNDHPRRRGEKFNGSSYPLLFELAPTGLTATNPKATTAPLGQDESNPRAMGGERMVNDQVIDLRTPGRLRRVYAPFANLGEVRNRLSQILGHDQFDVIPLEALESLPDYVDPMGGKSDKLQSVKGTVMFTLEGIGEMVAKQKQLILRAYATNLAAGQEITTNSMAEHADQLEVLNILKRNGEMSVEAVAQEIRRDLQYVAKLLIALLQSGEVTGRRDNQQKLFKLA